MVRASIICLQDSRKKAVACMPRTKPHHTTLCVDTLCLSTACTRLLMTRATLLPLQLQDIKVASGMGWCAGLSAELARHANCGEGAVCCMATHLSL